MLRFQLLVLFFAGIVALPAQSQETLAVAYSGPWNIPFPLPDLAPRIGADTARPCGLESMLDDRRVGRGP